MAGAVRCVNEGKCLRRGMRHEWLESAIATHLGIVAFGLILGSKIRDGKFGRGEWKR
ncbi:hypothetical protein RBSWK_00397 [Rhodopirellula baltica SWK14]|uniref:Uncharacterized protein n=1 Tax=Rhodopirellula baltica SWK14 TaxID=993516 RepID=L7CPW0_RHOBT|nr:hypothetical protein RBSWK_00397 [Rhodopirellula baltica SWK14]